MKFSLPKFISLLTTLVLSVSAAKADIVSTATLSWTNTIQGQSVRYSSLEAAAVGGVTYWCALDANRSYFSSCYYGGMDQRNEFTVITNIGAYPLGFATTDYYCPDGGQMFPTWNDYNGVIHTPACVIWNASPPPPPPPPPKKVVVIDPGHGLTCPSIGQAAGAIGLTDFPPSNPPAGRLREDDLTVAIALQAERLLSTKYKVVLTKRDVNSCPSLRERGRIANNANAKVFVSIHINAPNTIFGMVNPIGNGTSVLFNTSKSAASDLAEQMSTSVSQNLGTNNRGSQANDTIAVLKPTVTNMTAVLVEVARLSGSDEQILHSSESATKAASGIQSTVQAYVGN